MNELALFAGILGGGYASLLLGRKIIGYVEKDDYCCSVIKQRIKDGVFHNAPIFCDIKSFIDEGYAGAYTGMVDIITGGVPCQPWANCGLKKQENDERNLWPETIECMRIIQPRYGFFENVTGILSSEYFGRIIIEFSKIGYVCAWTTIGSGDIGWITEGKRVWILCIKTDGAMLESVDIQKDIKSYSEESCRREYTRAISSMLSQDDYTRIKRNINDVTRGKQRLKAIGNAQSPPLAKLAWEILKGEE